MSKLSLVPFTKYTSAQNAIVISNLHTKIQNVTDINILLISQLSTFFHDSFMPPTQKYFEMEYIMHLSPSDYHFPKYLKPNLKCGIPQMGDLSILSTASLAASENFLKNLSKQTTSNINVLFFKNRTRTTFLQTVVLSSLRTCIKSYSSAMFKL